MTAFFVKKFKRENKCSACKADKVSGYEMCDTHLTAAKMRFRRWAAERRGIGRCAYCDRKGYRGELRCVLHKKINRERCARWMKAHPEHSRQQWLKRLELRAARTCLCWARGALEPGQRRCNACIERRPAYFVKPRIDRKLRDGKKRCSKCDRLKVAKEFHGDNRAPDALYSRCRSCRSTFQQAVAQA